jgi:hypothetical protein
LSFFKVLIILIAYVKPPQYLQNKKPLAFNNIR